MSDVFIAHVEEDADVALEIALGLEEAGYTTWCYEVDSIPGPSYLLQTGQAVVQCKAFVLVISPHSVGSRQVTKEIVRAHEGGKEFIPVRQGITHIEFQTRQPEWREAVGAAASIEIPPEGVVGVLPRMIDGLRKLGIHPGRKVSVARIAQIRKVLSQVQRGTIVEKVGQPPVPTGELELESTAAGKFKLVSCNEYKNGASFHFENIDPDSLTGAVSAFLVKEGYKLEEGRPENGIYGKGSKALRAVFGGLAGFRFHVVISPEPKGAQLEFYKAMHGFGWGLSLLGYWEMNRALASRVSKLKSLPETQTAIVAERKPPTKQGITTEHVTVPAGAGIAKEQAGVPAWAAVRTAKPKAAGILSIIAGVIGLIVGLAIIVGGEPFGWVFFVPGIPAVVGGVYAIRRKVWGLALAGAICSLVSASFLLGIAAIILVVLARNEFK